MIANAMASGAEGNTLPNRRVINRAKRNHNSIDGATYSAFDYRRMVRITGYHDNLREFIQLGIDSGLPKATMDKLWFEGVQDRRNGVVCHCYRCERLSFN